MSNENLPQPVTPTLPSGIYAQASFIPTLSLKRLFTDLVGGDAGYVSGPYYSTFDTNGLAALTNDSMALNLTGVTTLVHDVVLTYKLTDNGSDSEVVLLPVGGTTVQIGVSDELGNLYQTQEPTVFNFVSLRKYSNGVHDNMILRGSVVHNVGDVVRLQVQVTNSARMHMFGVNWSVRTV